MMPGPGLKRYPDWDIRLRHFLEEMHGKPFVRGSRDCALFAADAVLAMTGIDLAADFRGLYDDLAGAKALLKKRGGGLVSVVTARLGPARKNLNFAGRGDVVMLRGPEGPSLGVIDLSGRRIAGFDVGHGLLFHPIVRAEKAWRV